MFHRLQQFAAMTAEDRVYRPRAYGNPRPDGSWDGWLVFFPADGGTAIASNRETTQPSFHAVTGWAASLSAVYLEGALERALRLQEQPPALTELAPAEYDALEDAEQLETSLEDTAANPEAEARQEATKDARAVAADAGGRRRKTKKGAK